MFAPNGTLVIFVVLFLIFMMLLDQIMLKPVGRAIQKRNQKAKHDHEEAQKARQEASNLLEGYESKLKETRIQAHNEMSSAVAKASAEKAELLQKVHRSGLAKLEEAKARIADEREKLIDDLVAEERALVEEITQKILGEPVAVQLDASNVRKNLEET